MRLINSIIIHCAATPNGRSLVSTAKDGTRITPDIEIDAWHRARGFARDDAARAAFNPGLTSIGYHFVIGIDGATYTGRGLGEIGAHAQNYNAKSIGICLVGIDQYSLDQWNTLAALVRTYQNLDGRRMNIVGHRDLPNVAKSCPGFSVARWLENGMRPFPNQIYTPPGKNG